MKRCRIRDLGLEIGGFPTGRFNAITDVSRIKVGHSTIVRGSGKVTAQGGPARTGVTAVLPSDGNVYLDRVVAAGAVLHGGGEASGLVRVMGRRLIDTPILLTNTLSVGVVSEAVIDHMLRLYPGFGEEHDAVVPLVGECDDSWLNDIAGSHVGAEHVAAALEGARSGPVAEGNVGGGTGLVSCGFKGGIGTSSRVVRVADESYTVGVLVMAGFGRMEDLRVDGIPVGRLLAPEYRQSGPRRDRRGSVVVVLATEAPLLPHQLEILAQRAGVGIGRAGSSAGQGCGEIVLAFSSANTIPRERQQMVSRVRVLLSEGMDPLCEAAADAAEESVLNALCMAEDMTGANGRSVPALPLDKLKKLLDQRK
ncbi:MAG: P1 family peptidase [Elusimicrobiota bacterium]